ncbi:MAG: molybdenum transporter substrate-binding protein [Paenibacillaceae bacterium]|jgi:molybdate transport system substrate-binding protein|nr:molybdenum transporter substrate-binding protein [Paenibacillaceae bacterium]
MNCYKKRSKSVSLALFSFLLAIALSLSGCGGNKENTAASPSAAATVTAAATSSPSPSPSPSPQAQPVELTVSAAASLTESLNEIKKTYETEFPHVKIIYNFGASGTLQQQIENGAPADLFLSAGKSQMTALVEKQLVESAATKNLLINDLVLIVGADSKDVPASVEDLSKDIYKKLAVGTPESVPAGNYAKEALTYFKLWDTLQPKMVFTKDVKQVLSYVETGNTEAGFVYKTDALTSTKVKIALTVDPKSHKAVEYPMGIIKATKNKAEAEKLYSYLQSKAAMDVFLNYGFTAPQ